MDGKVTQVTLVVTDQTKSLDYYTRKIGFEKKTDVTPPGSYRWVTVGPKGQDLEFALWPLGSRVEAAQEATARKWAPASSPPIVIRVSDCQKVYQEMSARGVQFAAPPREYPWGTNATFQDPDGNLFSLSQLPSKR